MEEVKQEANNILNEISKKIEIHYQVKNLFEITKGAVEEQFSGSGLSQVMDVRKFVQLSDDCNDYYGKVLMSGAGLGSAEQSVNFVLIKIEAQGILGDPSFLPTNSEAYQLELAEIRENVDKFGQIYLNHLDVLEDFNRRFNELTSN